MRRFQRLPRVLSRGTENLRSRRRKTLRGIGLLRLVSELSGDKLKAVGKIYIGSSVTLRANRYATSTTNTNILTYQIICDIIIQQLTEAIAVMKVIGYARVSTDEQAKSGLGLEAQIAKIRSYADLFELTVTDIIIDDGVSGKNLKRPGLIKAIRAIKAGEAEGLLVAKLDRLTRNVADLGTLVQSVFDKAELYSVSEQINTKNAAGRLVLNVLVSVAQWERETICERTSDALQAKKARGEKTGGNVPFGFEVVNGKLIENEAEQAVIEKIKELRASGLSLRKIAERLNEEGIGTKTGKQWNATQISRIAA